MIVLKKKNSNNTYFDFDKILINGNKIKEQPNLINKKQFVNGRRKKVITNYTDVVIEINLGCFDGDTLYNYLQKLQDGEYMYYSLKDKEYKSAEFIVTLPEQVINNSATEVIINDFTAVLEKSGDVT